ncbi:MAG: Unknown protein [uncultured Sulfurovum sp.]|uniref:Translocation and assembly module TamB C-terminal domain-containing protein n=1 Tax=uncultured Sulfurovum sp. TaxID=269237 RepID=A0A6S6TWI3_9BACT|nr:MAG: Unknown protein [uncultured Sulfurovum sp.]
MKKSIFFIYRFIAWFLLSILFLVFILFFFLETPAPLFKLLEAPLKKEGISYGKIEGSLLSGFVVHDLNYQDQVKAKSLALKVDLYALQNRVLYIDKLELEEGQIEKQFLSDLLENNSSTQENNATSPTLPFDRVIVNEMLVSIKESGYQNYYVNKARLRLKDFETDMKTKHKGDVSFRLDSNVSKLELEAKIEDNNYDLKANMEAEELFINPILEEYKLELPKNPKLNIIAKGDLEKLNFNVQSEVLDLNYEPYKVVTEVLSLEGYYRLKQQEVQLKIHSKVDSNVAKLKIDSDAFVNLNDINKSLKFDVNTELKPKKLLAQNPLIKEALTEQNISIETFPNMVLIAKGDMNKVDFKTTIDDLKISQNKLELKIKSLLLEGHSSPLQGDSDVKLLTSFDSSFAQGELDSKAKLNFKDLEKSLVFELNSKLKAHKKDLNFFLKEQNITINTFPNMILTAKGDMNKVDFKTTLDNLKVSQNKLNVKVNKLLVEGNSSPLQGDSDIKLITSFDSSFAQGELDSKAKLNFKDLEKSLVFELNSKLKVHKKDLNFFLQEQNITINTFPNMILTAKGDMNKVDFKTTLDNLKVSQNKLNVKVNKLLVEGNSSPLKGDTKVKLLSDFDSSIAKGKLDTKAKLNFKDLEKSLVFEVSTQLEAYDSYLNPLLKEHNISIVGITPLALNASGNMTKLQLKAKVSSTLSYEKMQSKVHLETEDIYLNLEKEEVKGALDFNAKGGKALAFSLKSNFSGNYMNPEKMISTTQLRASNFNAFGVNLSTLMPLNLDVESSSNGVQADMEAKGLALEIESSDYNNIDFLVKSTAIYPSKIIKLPEALKGKFIKLDLKGDVSLKEQYFTINGLLESNKNFKTKLDAFSKAEGLNVNLSTKHLKVEAKGNLKSKNINATLKVDSLEKLQEELLTLYPFTPVEVEGALNVDAGLRGEVISATLASSKLAFKGFAIEDIVLQSDYEKELLSINKFSFKTTGFKDNRLNQKFYLNQKGYVNLGAEKKLLLDMHPKILLKGNGTEENLNAVLQIEELALGYPNYGETSLSCDIDYIQEGDKKRIKGGVFLDKLKVFYESKFLDPSQDNDVIIINKKKQSKEERDSFLEDTAIDLSIYTSQGKYKTKDIDLVFDVNLKAEKKFGKNLGILGRVEDINGRVEQSPKFFTVVNSNIVFQGREEINPLLDLVVEHELPDILITINIHGNAKRPKLTFTSEPPLPKKDILSYLLLGVSTTGLGEGKGSLGREAQLFIMNQAARDLAYEVDLDRVFVKDDGTGEGYAVQVGKKVGEDTMFVIENSKEGNSFILEYDVSKNIKIEVGQHQKTVPSQSIDIFFRKKFE